MELTYHNYGKVLAASLLQQAGKCIVRECDESPARTYVAYVDEGAETFDVSITFNQKGYVERDYCDCGQPVFCRHKTALLIHVGNALQPHTGANRAKRSSKAKKDNPATTLLQEVDISALKAWLSDLFVKNKDAELAFVQYFTAEEKQDSPEEVEKLTTEAIRAVVKNKKKLDVSEVKKLVELWEKVHTPTIRYYQDHCTEPKAFLLFHTLLESCLRYQEQIRTNSSRIPKYAEHRLKESVPALLRLVQQLPWETAIGFFIKNLQRSGHPEIRLHYLKHLDNLAAASDPLKRSALIKQWVAHYRGIDPRVYLNGDVYTETLFNSIAGSGLFSEYSDLFTPIHFNNPYNERLIGLLMEQGDLVRAAQYGEEQLRANLREEFNIPYWKLLRQIYRTRQQEQKLIRILTDLVPYTFDADDFAYVANRLYDEEQRRKWRLKMWNRARAEAPKGNEAAFLFNFRLLHQEQDYKGMVQNVSPFTPYSLVLEYAEVMAAADKVGLLKAIININDAYLQILWGYDNAAMEAQRNIFPGLLTLLLMHFNRFELIGAFKQYLKNSGNTVRNAFVNHVDKQLQLF